MCPICNGTGWLLPDVPVGHPDFGKAVPCECSAAAIAAKRMARLDKIDGLTAAERRYSFHGMEGMASASQRTASKAIQVMLGDGHGMITLTGEYGVGKSHLLIAAINESKAAGVPATYTTMRNLLTYLRGAFDPNAEGTFLERWDLLLQVPVLAVDELDKSNATPWALEQFSALVDHRWRHMHEKITLFALNAPIDRLPGDVADRLEDGRATVITLTGQSRRPFLR